MPILDAYFMFGFKLNINLYPMNMLNNIHFLNTFHKTSHKILCYLTGVDSMVSVKPGTSYLPNSTNIFVNRTLI